MAILGLLGVLAVSTPAWSSDDNSQPTPSSTTSATPNPDAGIYELGGESVQPPVANTGTDAVNAIDASTGAAADELPPGAWVQSAACDTVAASGCVVQFGCPDGSEPIVWTYVLDAGGHLGSYSQCPEDPPPTQETTPTQTVNIPAEVLKAFKEVALPESTINVQPPGGETLVNLPTILSTSADRHQIPVRLGRVNLDILLEVWPSRFVWNHGDGTSQETTTPGKAWTEGADLAELITHTYSKTSKGLALSVDTTWSAQFRVVGQANWRPVDGTVTIDGAPVAVAVLEAKPQLVR
jgi:hypothetical protein